MTITVNIHRERYHCWEVVHTYQTSFVPRVGEKVFFHMGTMVVVEVSYDISSPDPEHHEVNIYVEF